MEHSPSKDLFEAVLTGALERPRRDVQTWGNEPYQVAIGGVALSLGCRHCDPAPCVDACITGAMHKEDGQTVCDDDQCVGCWMCVMACPYGAIAARESALKCDLCPDRSDLEGQARYACVEACPTDALFVGPFEAFKAFLDEPVEEVTL